MDNTDPRGSDASSFCVCIDTKLAVANSDVFIKKRGFTKAPGTFWHVIRI